MELRVVVGAKKIDSREIWGVEWTSIRDWFWCGDSNLEYQMEGVFN